MLDFLTNCAHLLTVQRSTETCKDDEKELEGKINSRTDIISDRRLQRSKHGSNCARSSEQQDMLALG